MTRAEAKGSNWKFWVLSGAVLLLTAGSAYLYVQLQLLKKEAAAVRESIVAEISGFREASAVASQINRRRLDGLRQEVDVARRQVTLAAGAAKREAQSHVEQLARNVVDLQEKHREQVQGELTGLRAVTTAATLKLGDVSTDVHAVRSDAEATRSDLDKTIADLKRMTGDLGVMSGLIATNSQELAALRALGERDYIEFDLTKEKQPRRIGDIALALKKTDPKRHRFSIELIAEAKKIEKKDRSVNEPVQFYTPKARQPYELVVNEVRKDQVRGYISVPKVRMLRELTELRR